MTDMEFDEIDKAVSTVMSDAAETTSLENKEPESVAVRRGTVSSDIHVRTANPPVLARRPLGSRPKNGRFMDMVHSSSDMKPEQKHVSAPSAKPVYDYPSGAAEKRFEENTSLEETVDEPMSSPFISDAKVEKRPLGAFSEHGQAEMNDHHDRADDESHDAPDTPVVENIDTPLPAELNNDVLSIETDDDNLPEDTPVSGETPELIENKEPVHHYHSKHALESPASPDTANGSDDQMPPVPSIIQQYQEKPSTATEQSGAIFDTEQYHAPLVHAPKKKSGWLVVLWIFALIVIGAGIGAAAYYFVLPNFL